MSTDLAAFLLKLCDNADATGRLIHPGQIRDAIKASTKPDAASSPKLCGFAFVGNVGTFECDRFKHADPWHWDSLAEFGWTDPAAS